LKALLEKLLAEGLIKVQSSPAKVVHGLNVRIVTRFGRLSSTERVLFLHTALLVLAIRVGLLVLPVRAVRRRLVIRTDDKSAALHYSVEQIAWAVTAASRFVPGATCLAQALAAQRLLGRSGHHASVRIGVTKDDQLGFQAHAWVVCGEQVVIGGPEVNQYVLMVTWEERS
jgi:hypothetical protein